MQMILKPERSSGGVSNRLRTEAILPGQLGACSDSAPYGGINCMERSGWEQPRGVTTLLAGQSTPTLPHHHPTTTSGHTERKLQGAKRRPKFSPYTGSLGWKTKAGWAVRGAATFAAVVASTDRALNAGGLEKKGAGGTFEGKEPRSLTAIEQRGTEGSGLSELAAREGTALAKYHQDSVVVPRFSNTDSTRSDPTTNTQLTIARTLEEDEEEKGQKGAVPRTAKNATIARHRQRRAAAARRHCPNLLTGGGWAMKKAPIERPKRWVKGVDSSALSFHLPLANKYALMLSEVDSEKEKKKKGEAANHAEFTTLEDERMVELNEDKVMAEEEPTRRRAVKKRKIATRLTKVKADESAPSKKAKGDVECSQGQSTRTATHTSEASARTPSSSATAGGNGGDDHDEDEDEEERRRRRRLRDTPAEWIEGEEEEECNQLDCLHCALGQEMCSAANCPHCRLLDDTPSTPDGQEQEQCNDQECTHCHLGEESCKEPDCSYCRPKEDPRPLCPIHLPAPARPRRSFSVDTRDTIDSSRPFTPARLDAPVSGEEKKAEEGEEKGDTKEPASVSTGSRVDEEEDGAGTEEKKVEGSKQPDTQYRVPLCDSPPTSPSPHTPTASDGVIPMAEQETDEDEDIGELAALLSRLMLEEGEGEEQSEDQSSLVPVPTTADASPTHSHHEHKEEVEGVQREEEETLNGHDESLEAIEFTRQSPGTSLVSFNGNRDDDDDVYDYIMAGGTGEDGEEEGECPHCPHYTQMREERDAARQERDEALAEEENALRRLNHTTIEKEEMEREKDEEIADLRRQIAALQVQLAAQQPPLQAAPPVQQGPPQLPLPQLQQLRAEQIDELDALAQGPSLPSIKYMQLGAHAKRIVQSLKGFYPHRKKDAAAIRELVEDKLTNPTLANHANKAQDVLQLTTEFTEVLQPVQTATMQLMERVHASQQNGGAAISNASVEIEGALIQREEARAKALKVRIVNAFEALR